MLLPMYMYAFVRFFLLLFITAPINISGNPIDYGLNDLELSSTPGSDYPAIDDTLSSESDPLLK